MNPAEREFIARLTALAAMAGFTLTPELIALYDRNLCELGYGKLCQAIEQIMLNRRSRDPFPSIREIREVIAPALDPEVEAMEAVGRIVQAVGRFGPYRGEEARAFVGELGWLVVQRDGGWPMVCQVLSDDNIGTLKAQWRQMAKALHARARMGIKSAPGLPEAERGQVLPFNPAKLLPEIPK